MRLKRLFFGIMLLAGITNVGAMALFTDSPEAAGRCVYLPLFRAVAIGYYPPGS